MLYVLAKNYVFFAMNFAEIGTIIVMIGGMEQAIWGNIAYD